MYMPLLKWQLGKKSDVLIAVLSWIPAIVEIQGIAVDVVAITYTDLLLPQCFLQNRLEFQD